MSNDHSKRVSKVNRNQGARNKPEASDEGGFEEAPSEAGQAPGNTNEGPEAILTMLKGVESDILGNAEEASGVIVLVSWKDGTITTGWTGGFDLERTAGKLFTLATDFSVVNLRHRTFN